MARTDEEGGGGGAVINVVENGLTLSGATIRLGGPLTQDTTVDGVSTHSFNWLNLVNLESTVTTKFSNTRGEYSLFNDAANSSVGDSVGHTWVSGTETVAQYASGAAKSQSMIYTNSVGGVLNRIRVNNNGFNNVAVGTGYNAGVSGGATDVEMIYSDTAAGDSTGIKAEATDLFINEGTTDTGGTGVATAGQFLKLVDETTGEVKYGGITSYRVSAVAAGAAQVTIVSGVNFDAATALTIPFDTEDAAVTGFSNVAGVVTVADAGTYSIGFNPQVSALGTGSSSVNIGVFSLFINGVQQADQISPTIHGSIGPEFQFNATYGGVYTLPAAATVEVRGFEQAGNRNLRTLSSGTFALSLTRLS